MDPSKLLPSWFVVKGGNRLHHHGLASQCSALVTTLPHPPVIDRDIGGGKKAKGGLLARHISKLGVAAHFHVYTG